MKSFVKWSLFPGEELNIRYYSVNMVRPDTQVRENPNDSTGIMCMGLSNGEIDTIIFPIWILSINLQIQLLYQSQFRVSYRR